jgi:hypothetical protein
MPRMLKTATMIGMGPRLAELCLAVYGGHFLRVQNAIIDLSLQQTRFKALALLPDLASNIIKCLDTYMSTRPLLEAMAKSGFAPIGTRENAAVDMIVKLNIGGVVRTGSTICGLSETKWSDTECDYALIPSSESVRLVIAMTLNVFPAVKVEKTTTLSILPKGNTLFEKRLKKETNKAKKDTKMTSEPKKTRKAKKDTKKNKKPNNAEEA